MYIHIRRCGDDTHETHNSSETGNLLKLTCGIGSTTITYTTQSVEQITTTATTTTTAVPVTTTVPTTNIATTTTIPTTSTDTNELAITTFTSTDSYVTTNKAKQPEHKELSDTTETHNNPEFSFDNDGNYSTVDLDEILPGDDLTGDYSSNDLVNLTPTESNINGITNEKPIFAPKPKQNVIIKDDVYSVPDKKRVKHLTAPGENGCEYAVVNKPNTSNVDKVKINPQREICMQL
ncbi:unnamed protein product [Mytilus edulis]|uniref:Uncharacterized protein n=1 Tax=Mytilus edulis TaxID=6550 RepID=A0A8S3V658_MYTED|nr:unnamed protein product [Mytilus edulis]